MANENSSERRTLTNRITWLLLALLIAWFLYRMLANPLLPDGSNAPHFVLPLADGSRSSLSLETLKGRVIVVDFWSTTCPPCLREMEELQAVHRQWEHRGVTVVGVAAGGESLAEVERFKKERGLSFPLVVDEGTVASVYKIATLPTLYVINRQGIIATSHRGYWDRSGIEKAIGEAFNP